MEESEIRLGKVFKEDFVKYARACLKIRTKSSALRALELNAAQLHIHKIAEEQRRTTGRVRIIVVKGRQQGCSTYIEGRLYWRTTHSNGVKTFILTHEKTATENLFEMSQRYHDNCPEEFRPSTGANNANELNFDRLDSGFEIGTAGNKGVGRSMTLQNFHGSEVAFWPNAEAHASGVMQCVPLMENTEIWLESTGNGPGDYFHAQWMAAVKGESEYLPVFVPWFWQPEYRLPGDFTPNGEELELANQYGLDLEQLKWRRIKIQELGGPELGMLKFKHEYPCTSEEAFEDTSGNKVIPYNIIRASVARQVASILTYRPIWGVDVGGEGLNADRSCLAKRQANTLLEPPITWQGKTTMQLAGLILREWEATPVKPAKIYIDKIGIGAGVVSRLLEYDFFAGVVVGINVSENDAVSELCYKMRDELWWRSRLWFEAAECKIPEQGCEPLILELGTPTYEPNSSGKVVVESKKDMAKRGVRSCDIADAFNLTFSGAEILFETPSYSPGGSHRAAYDPFSRDHLQRDTSGGGKHQSEWTPSRY